jgi:hypothetical protein
MSGSQSVQVVHFTSAFYTGVMGISLIVCGVAAAVAGGALMFFGSVLGRVLGAGLMVAGVLVAFTGLVMRSVLDLWIVHWLMDFSGMAVLVVGVILAALGLLGMLRGAVSRESPGE